MTVRLAICDDNHSFRSILRLVLGLEPDLEVVGEAADGVAAVQLVRDQQPDVLLLDVAMPEMDGIEALPLVLAASPETNVVMLTGFSSPKVREEALAAGAWAFLEKGVDVSEVTDAVRAAARSSVS